MASYGSSAAEHPGHRVQPHKTDRVCTHYVAVAALLEDERETNWSIRARGLPSDTERRMRVAGFVASSGAVAIGGRDYSNPDLGAMVESQVLSMTAYGMGASAFASLGGRGGRAPEIADGIARYLETSANRSFWVDGCELHYATEYSRSQCQCMAERIRAIDPTVHDREFSVADIRRTVQANPILLAGQLLACGVVEY